MKWWVLLSESFILSLVWRMSWWWPEGGVEGTNDRGTTIVAQKLCQYGLTAAEQWWKQSLGWNSLPALPFGSFEILGKFLSMFPHLQNEKHNSAHLLELLWGFGKRIQIKPSGICWALSKYEPWSWWWWSYTQVKFMEYSRQCQALF